MAAAPSREIVLGLSSVCNCRQHPAGSLKIRPRLKSSSVAAREVDSLCRQNHIRLQGGRRKVRANADGPRSVPSRINCQACISSQGFAASSAGNNGLHTIAGTCLVIIHVCAKYLSPAGSNATCMFADADLQHLHRAAKIADRSAGMLSPSLH